MLTTEEKLFVIDQFSQYLGQAGSIRAIAVVGMPPELRVLVPDGSNALVTARAVIEISLDDGWKRQPPALIDVLRSFAALNPKIAQIIARIEQLPAPSIVDPLAAVVLETQIPFIDRAELRRNLRDFGTGWLRPILVVNGAPKTGRSYTKELLQHVCRPPASALCPVAKSSWMEPEDLAAELVSYVGGNSVDIPSQRDATNQERRVTQLVNWVLSQAIAARGRAVPPPNYWFVLDGFGDADLNPWLRYFIVQLANKITTGVYAADFRLVLLEFDRATLTVPPGRILTDQTAAVDNQEIVNSVNAILATSTKVTAADWPAFANRVLQDLPTGDDRMPVLNQRLRELVEVVK